MHNSTHTKLPMLLLIVLGTMTAFGPMIIDMYLIHQRQAYNLPYPLQ